MPEVQLNQTPVLGGVGLPRFETNELLKDAVVGNLELIGEAATRIPEDVRLAHPEIPWRQIIAMRNPTDSCLPG